MNPSPQPPTAEPGPGNSPSQRESKELGDVQTYANPESTQSGGLGGSRPTQAQFAGYIVEAVLGEGGMGIVYRARHERLDRAVAIKALLTSGHVHSDAVKRMLNEIEAIARLRHPNIIQILDSGHVDGLPFYVMELVEGGHLGQRLAKSPPGWREAAEICRCLAKAVHHAHVRGIVHRDLKPSNVLLTAEGDLKVTDFGIAKRNSDNRGLTMTGTVLGTPGYLSPEQAEGKLDQITPASDIFAIGVILYEMIAGRRPFDGLSEMEILSRIIHDDPPSPAWFRPGVPRDLETICLKCLQKKPQRRYQSAEELDQDIDRFLNNQVIHARRTGPLERSVKWCRRHPAWATMIGMLVIAIPGIIVGLSVANRKLSNALARSERLVDNNSGFSRWIIDQHLSQLDVLNGASRVQFELAMHVKQFLEGTRDESSLGPEVTHYLANAYEKVADVLGGISMRHLGRARDAADGYRSAISLLETLRGESPSDEVEADYVRCKVKLAGVLWQTEGLDAATKLFDEIHPLVEQRFRESPRNWIGTLLYLNSSRYEVAKAMNNLPSATAVLDEVDRLIALNDELQAETLVRMTGSLPVWVAMNRGLLASKQGDHKSALTWHRRELELARKEVAGNSNAALQDQLVSAFIHTSDELIWLGEHEPAIELLKEGVGISERLLQSDPENAHYMTHLATVLERQSGALFQTLEFEKSLAPIKRCLELRRRILEIDDSNLETQRHLRVALSAIGNSFLQMELIDEAAPPLEEALNLARKVAAVDQPELQDLEAIGEGYIGMGTLEFKRWMKMFDSAEFADILAAPEFSRADDFFRLAVDAYDRIADRAPLTSAQQSKLNAAKQFRAKLNETAESFRELMKKEIF